jgi:hypothetical protein
MLWGQQTKIDTQTSNKLKSCSHENHSSKMHDWQNESLK